MGTHVWNRQDLTTEVLFRIMMGLLIAMALEVVSIPFRHLLLGLDPSYAVSTPISVYIPWVVGEFIVGLILVEIILHKMNKPS